MEALADLAIQKEAQRREEERQRWEEQRRREETRREQQADANQWRRFRELAARYEEARRVRDLIEELKQQAPRDGDEARDLEAWIAWAEAKVAAWDPMLRGASALMREVRAVTAFDYPDNDR